MNNTLKNFFLNLIKKKREFLKITKQLIANDYKKTVKFS